MTKRDFDRINNRAKFSLYIIINALFALPPSCFNVKLVFFVPDFTGVGAGAGSSALRTTCPITSSN
jgi:hypothetical protein